jgi:hypothetical protein
MMEPMPEQTPGPATACQDLYPGFSMSFRLGLGVTRAAQTQPYERASGDPIYRPLRILTADPSVTSLHSSVAVINVPYEPLLPGPIGALFEVDDAEVGRDRRYIPVNLEDHRVLLQNGLNPSRSDHRFHQQIVYAVCSSTYAAFRHALGRSISWGLRHHSGWHQCA